LKKHESDKDELKEKIAALESNVEGLEKVNHELSMTEKLRQQPSSPRITTASGAGGAQKKDGTIPAWKQREMERQKEEEAKRQEEAKVKLQRVKSIKIRTHELGPDQADQDPEENNIQTSQKAEEVEKPMKKTTLMRKK